MNPGPPASPRWFVVDPSRGHYLYQGEVPTFLPISQGDVFSSIPFPIAKHPSPEAEERRRPDFRRIPLNNALDTNVNDVMKRISTKLRMGLLLPHTCEYYEMQAGPENPIRVLALVRERHQEKIPEDWDGAFNLFPLPNLLGDGRYYLAQLDTVSTVEEAFVTKGNRVAALSFEGWLALHQRLAHFFTRIYAPWGQLDSGQRPYWDEVQRDQATSEGETED